MRNIARQFNPIRHRLPAALALIGAMLVISTPELSGQPPSTTTYGPPTTPYMPYTPVSNHYGGPDPYAYNGPDPYAYSTPQSNGWFNGMQIGLPTSDSLGDRMFFRAEYLYWWTNGMDLPPLVTTSPILTPQDEAGVLGEPGTSILFGNQSINTGGVGGLRTTSGLWFRPARRFGISTQFFQLSDQKDGFSASGDGEPIIGRPYFDALNGRQSAQLVSYPGLVSGDIRVSSKTQLKSYMFSFQGALAPASPLACNPCEQPNRVDGIIGYRYLELKDKLSFSENLDSQIAPATVAVNESFSTKNKFGGMQLGVTHRAHYRRALLESRLHVAIGNNKQTVNISGDTVIDDAGFIDTYDGGVLAQRTNIGGYSRDEFTMIPELGTTLAIRVTNRLHATVGYSVVYFPNVVRAGDQIDTDLNPDLLAPEDVPFDGPLRPQFSFVESDFWAHGLNIGGEFRF